MTKSTDDALPALKSEVQRLLGQSILQLQDYERLMKAILTAHDINWTKATLELAQEARAADFRGMTLGSLVNHLLDSFFSVEGNTAPGDPSDSTAQFRFKFQHNISAEDYARLEAHLWAFVQMRNDLVHHFLDRHRLNNIEGWQSAQTELIASSALIRQRFDDLREWDAALHQSRIQTRDFISTPEITELLVNGTIPWPSTTIVSALQTAYTLLAQDGWAPVGQAAKWVGTHYPDELPKNYLCSSWRHVLHASGLFELRRPKTEGQRAAWYRPKTIALN